MTLNVGTVKLEVTLTPGSGKFEVCENGALVASGNVFVALDDELEFDSDDTGLSYSSGNCKSTPMPLEPDDIYKELRLRGYDYGPSFRGIVSAAGNGNTL